MVSRRKKQFKHLKKHSIFYLVLVIIIFTIGVSAQEESLFIEINEYETQDSVQDNIFFEGKKYEIYAGYRDVEGNQGIAYNVTIEVPWNSFFIDYSDDPSDPFWIELEAPEYEQYSYFTISASVLEEKDPLYGYESAEEEIYVLKGKLTITKDRETAKEKESFSITVSDQTNSNPIEDSYIYVDYKNENFGPYYTDENGRAFIESPEISEDYYDVLITAFKEGYSEGKSSIRIQDSGAFAFSDNIMHIFMASVVLIFAILFVSLRKKMLKPKKIKKQGLFLKKNNFSENIEKNKIDLNKVDKGPRVEEIRIHGKEKIKETENLKPEKPIQKVSHSKKKPKYEWFKGQDYVKYKIDELTGELDSEKVDKWFEGESNIKSKVDEKLKNKKKEEKD